MIKYYEICMKKSVYYISDTKDIPIIVSKDP